MAKVTKVKPRVPQADWETSKFATGACGPIRVWDQQEVTSLPLCRLVATHCTGRPPCSTALEEREQALFRSTLLLRCGGSKEAVHKTFESVVPCELGWGYGLACGDHNTNTEHINAHTHTCENLNQYKSLLTITITWPCSLCSRLLHSCYDDASKFVYLLAKPGCHYLEQEDFIPLLQVQPMASGSLWQHWWGRSIAASACSGFFWSMSSLSNKNYIYPLFDIYDLLI